MKPLTANQQKVLHAMLNPQNYKLSIKLVLKETGISCNKGVYRAMAALKKRGLPVFSTGGTSYPGFPP